MGVSRQTRCQRSKLIDPPPPTPPRHAQRRVEGGEIPRMTSRSRRVFSREVLSFLPALFKERAQGKPGARCTRGLACKKGRRAHTSIQVQRKQSGLPCAMGLTASFELSPVIGLSCHRRQQPLGCQLDASVEASGPHDFTVRVGAVRQRHRPRPSHPTPRP